MIATEQQLTKVSGGDPRTKAAQVAAENADKTLGYLIDLIRIPTDNPPGDCSVAAARVATEFRAVGLGVERYDVAPASGPPVPTVIGWLGPRTMSPDLVLNALIQASDASETLGLNLRLNWHYRPGSDLFVVYNHGWDLPDLDRFDDLSSRTRQLVVKWTWAWQT